jgi:hypothetical protein
MMMSRSSESAFSPGTLQGTLARTLARSLARTFVCKKIHSRDKTVAASLQSSSESNCLFCCGNFCRLSKKRSSHSSTTVTSNSIFIPVSSIQVLKVLNLRPSGDSTIQFTSWTVNSKHKQFPNPVCDQPDNKFISSIKSSPPKQRLWKFKLLLETQSVHQQISIDSSVI